MRIALTTESFLPYVSGVTVSVDALARGLGARGHDVLLVAPRPAAGALPVPVGSPGPEPEYAWLPSYQLPRIAPSGYRMTWPTPLAGAWQRARAWRPDVVHAHSPFVTGILAQRLARAAGAPLVFTHHTRFADYGHYLGPLAAPAAALADAYLRRFWSGCAAVIAPSGDLADDIRVRLAASRRDRVHVVPTGIDVAGIRALAARDARPEVGWPPESVVIVSLGRLAPEKSVATILDAMGIVIEEAPSARLLLIGGGPSEPELRRRVAAAPLAGRVHLTGALPRPDALALLRGADLFAFASRTETQGLALAEALAAGLPCVAVAGPGVADSVRDGLDGLIVAAEPAEGRAERLARALVELVGDGERRAQLAGQASGDAERFDLARRVAEVEAVYQVALESSRSREGPAARLRM